MAKTTRDLVRAAVRAAEERKAQDLVTLDLRGRSSVTDYFVLASGTSDTHVRAIAEHIRLKLKEAGQRPISSEGHEDGTWILLDFVDFVVHVFHYEKRIYFGLEELWSDAKRVTFRAAPAKTAPTRKPAKKPSRKPAAKAAAKRPAKKAAGKTAAAGKRAGKRTDARARATKKKA